MKILVKLVVGRYKSEEELSLYIHELNKMMNDDSELELIVINQIEKLPIVDKDMYSKIASVIEHIHYSFPVKAEERYSKKVIDAQGVLNYGCKNR